MALQDTHNWVQLEAGSPFYSCKCGVSGKRIGGAWPPIRDPRFVQPDYASCEKAKNQRVFDELRKYGVKPEDFAE